MWNLFIADLKMIARNKQWFFWSLAFPLIFTCIFGLFFSKDSSAGTIGLVDKSNTEIGKAFVTTLKDSDLFRVESEDSTDSIKSEMKKNKLSGGLEVPEGFGDPSKPGTKINVILDAGSSTVSQALTLFVGNYLNSVNFQVAGVKPMFGFEKEEVGGANGVNLTYFDFILPGLLGMALMNSSIIGISASMTRYKEDKILKRITTTPLKTYQFLVPEVISRLVVNVIQITLILLVGHYLFGAHIIGSLWGIYGIAMVGALLFQLIGFAVAALSRNPEAAEGLSTVITIPMMFLSGVFFPIDALPTWLLPVVNILPLAPLLRMIRTIFLESGNPFTNIMNPIIIVGWIVVALAISLWRFRLSED